MTEFAVRKGSLAGKAMGPSTGQAERGRQLGLKIGDLDTLAVKKFQS